MGHSLAIIEENISCLLAQLIIIQSPNSMRDEIPVHCHFARVKIVSRFLADILTAGNC